MDLRFEKFVKNRTDKVVGSPYPLATLSHDGRINFNKAATELYNLKEAKCADIYFSASTKTLAVEILKERTDTSANAMCKESVNVGFSFGGIHKRFNIVKETQKALKVSHDIETGMILVHGIKCKEVS